MEAPGSGKAGTCYGAWTQLASFLKIPRELIAVQGVCLRRTETGEALARENQIVFTIDSYDARLARSDMDVVDERTLVSHLN